MLSLTIADLFSDKWETLNLDGCDIYVIRDHESDLIFYVGKSSRFVVTRLMEHFGKGDQYGGYPTSPDRVGHFVLDRLPRSGGWLIEFYRQDEILPDWMAKVLKGIPKDEWEKHPFYRNQPWREEDGVDKVWFDDIDEAEEVMIKKLRPCLNTIKNRNGRGLPMAYLDPGLYLGKYEAEADED